MMTKPISWTARTELLLGPDAMARLHSSCVVVVGVGGVGAAAAEMIARSGVGHLVLVDCDEFSLTNINRQLPALHSTLGLRKCEVIAERMKDINPEIEISTVDSYLNEENVSELLSAYSIDCVVDAIDTLSPKIALIQYCLGKSLPLVSSMGSGAKLDATKVRVSDISKTKMCPLAFMIRKRLHKLGIYSGFQAVFSEEAPRKEAVVEEDGRNKRSQVGSASWLPTVFGCVCAQTAVCRIAGIEVNF